MNYTFGVITVLLLLSNADTPAQECNDCHDAVTAYSNIHSVIEMGCDACHEVDPEEHPGDLDGEGNLNAAVPGLCYECHEVKDTMANVHSVFEMGSCMMCHQPHGSDTGALLRASDQAELCSGCHDVRSGEGSQHFPAAAGECSECHDPHQSKYTALLISEVPELCSDCHENKMSEENVHPVFEMGSCMMCHDPHSSKGTALLETESASDNCSGCHEAVTDTVSVHYPAAAPECMSCHDPHQSDTGALMISDQPELCFECHENEESDSVKTVHYPYTSECTSCHKAHSSNFPTLMTAEGGELCFECHTDISESIQNSSYLHLTITEGDACIKCHSPHISEFNSLLYTEEYDLCMNCHNREISVERNEKQKSVEIRNISKQIKQAESIHEPVKSGCSQCHNPHYSDFYSLLSESYPLDFYIDENPDAFKLCFECHNKSKVTEQYTETATGFRDGDTNMHFLHINRKKGRGCKGCHDVHAAPNPHLIADKVKFGNWMMPLDFEVTDEGGSCTPGCHAKYSYTR